MSCTITSTSSAPSLSQSPTGVRKRTSSFSTPKPGPYKVPRTGRALRRTISYAVLPEIYPDDTLDTSDTSDTSYLPPSSSHMTDCSSLVPYTRTLRFYKEQRERRRALNRTYSEHNLASSLPFSSAYSPPSPSRIPVSRPPAQTAHHSRATTSPLSPYPTGAAPRTYFRPPMRSRREPDLYRVAIIKRMRRSPEGQKILMMGPHLAISMMTATRELERIVHAVGKREKDKDREGGGRMARSESGDGVLTKSWVVVPEQDWEMVERGH